MPKKWVKLIKPKNGYTYRQEITGVLKEKIKYGNMNNWIFPQKIIKEGSFNDDF